MKRVLVVTPGSLVHNWGREFNKWLGRERIQVFTVDQVSSGRIVLKRAEKFCFSVSDEVYGVSSADI